MQRPRHSLTFRIESLVWRVARRLGAFRTPAAAATAYPQALGYRRVGNVFYRRWIGLFDDLDTYTTTPPAEPPLISVILAPRKGDTVRLRPTLVSVLEQEYADWEIVLYASSELRQELAEFAETIEPSQRLRTEALPVGPVTARSLGRGELLLFVQPGDRLARRALLHWAQTAIHHPAAAAIYCDDDRIDTDKARRDPDFKPDWDPDLFLSTGYAGPGIAVRSAALKPDFKLDLHGRCRPGPELILGLTQGLDAEIRHLPRVLYHVGDQSAGTDSSHLQRIEAELENIPPSVRVEPGRVRGTARVRWPLPSPAPTVTVIIPTGSRADLLQICVDSLLQLTDYPSFQVLVVEHRNETGTTHDYCRKLARRQRVRLLTLESQAFNYSAMNNLAVEEADSPLIALVNDDVEILHGDWLSEMVSLALRADIGAVGAKLLYPDRTVQHGGVLLGGGSAREPVAGHLFSRLDQDDPGYFGRAQVVRSVSAVTAACLVMRRHVFRQIGGFDADNLPVAFNDVDLCLRIGLAGYRILWTPFAELIHLESATRGAADQETGSARFAREVAFMRRRWPDRLVRDPFYNPSMDAVRCDFSPAFPPPTLGPDADTGAIS